MSVKEHSGELFRNNSIFNFSFDHSSPFSQRSQTPPLKQPLKITSKPSFCRCIFVSNHLPLIVKRDEVQGWVFELDEDALITQAREGLPEEMEAVYVGCLPVEVEGHEQEEVSQQLQTQFNCHPVFLGAELKNNYYKSK